MNTYFSLRNAFFEWFTTKKEIKETNNSLDKVYEQLDNTELQYALSFSTIPHFVAYDNTTWDFIVEKNWNAIELVNIFPSTPENEFLLVKQSYGSQARELVKLWIDKKTWNIGYFNTQGERINTSDGDRIKRATNIIPN